MTSTILSPAVATHGQFTLERVYDASPSRVFGAWTDMALKARWFIGPEGWMVLERRLDFRVGGEEVLHGRIRDTETLFTARYHLIEPDARMVYVYDMHLGGRHHSVSLATVEFVPEGAATRLRFTEQVAFVDGTPGDQGTTSRERGTAVHLDRIPAILASAAAH